MNNTVFNWVVAVIVAIVYIIVSLTFDCWAYSWLIWVVYAVYRITSYINQNKG